MQRHLEQRDLLYRMQRSNLNGCKLTENSRVSRGSRGIRGRESYPQFKISYLIDKKNVRKASHIDEDISGNKQTG